MDSPASSPVTPRSGGGNSRVQELLSGQNSPYGSTVRKVSRGAGGIQLADLSLQVEQMQKEISELKQSAAAQKKARKAAKDDTDELRQKLDGVTNALEIERTNNQNWLRANSTLRRELGEQQIRTAKLRRDHAALKTDAAKIKRFADTMISVVQREADEITEWKRLFQDYRELVASYLDDVNKVARQRLASTEKAIANSMETVEEAREIIKKARAGLEHNLNVGPRSGS